MNERRELNLETRSQLQESFHVDPWAHCLAQRTPDRLLSVLIADALNEFIPACLGVGVVILLASKSASIIATRYINSL